MITRLAVCLLVAAAACSTSSPKMLPPDADNGDVDGAAIDALVVPLPAWMLEDVQPASPRAGQTYGLSAFTDHTVVVALLEGH